MQRSDAVELLAVPGIPLVTEGDDLVSLIGEALTRMAAAAKKFNLSSVSRGDLALVAAVAGEAE